MRVVESEIRGGERETQGWGRESDIKQRAAD